MASAAAFWEFLRFKGLADIAPSCVRAGVLQIDSIRVNAHALEREGVQRWQLELLLASPGSGGASVVLPRQRDDLPPVRKRKRASFAYAEERARALQELDDDVLAKSTVGPMESRLLVWRRLCEAWEVPSFPLAEKNIRAYPGGRGLVEERPVSQCCSVLLGGSIVPRSSPPTASATIC